MSDKNIAKRMFLNTLSNYGLLIFSMVAMIILVKVLFTGLSRQDYGFWGLLWTIFGYSLLLDFGFGASIQKYTSQATVSEDWEKLNRLISTVFFNYCIFALVIVAITFILSFFIEPLSNLEPGSDIAYYRRIFILFGLGTAAVFPVGFAPEILRGMQLIYVRNNINFGCVLINLILMVWVVKAGYGLLGITFVTLFTHVGCNVVMFLYAGFKLRKLRLSIKYYTPSLIKEVMSFSLFAYIIMCSNIIIFKTDNLVISTSIGVTFVAFYQISSKIADIFKSFSMQFNDNLGPVASIMHTAGDFDSLARIQLLSSRIIGFLSTMIVIPLVAFVGPLFDAWLELDEWSSIVCAMILLASQYFYVVFRSSSIQILLMCDRQKELAIVSLVECIANLVLSVILVRYIGIIGVAIGTLIPNLVIGSVYNIPIACKFAGVSVRYFFKYSILSSILVGLVIGSLTYLLRAYAYDSIVNAVVSRGLADGASGISSYFAGHETIVKLLTLLLLSVISCCMYLLLFYRVGIYSDERKQLQSLIANFVKQRFSRKVL